MMTYVDHAQERRQRLADVDAQYIKAERVYVGRVCREGPEPYGVTWPEGAEIERLADLLWDMEELALKSGDAFAAEMVRWRRERDEI